MGPYWGWAVTYATDDANNWWNGNNRAIAFRRRWQVSAIAQSNVECPTGLNFQSVSKGFYMYTTSNPYKSTHVVTSGTPEGRLASFDMVTGKLTTFNSKRKGLIVQLIVQCKLAPEQFGVDS